jgi:hypothetical protein
MAQLVTDYDGLKRLKRALNRFSGIVKNSDLAECDVLKIVKKILSCNGHLNQLLRASGKYCEFMKAVCDCDKKGECDCGECSGKKTASDLFCVLNLLKCSQNLVLGFYCELTELLNALTRVYCGERNICIPCDEKLRVYVADLYCCPGKPNDDCCDESDDDVLIYGIAMITIIGLIFGGYSRCVVCPEEPKSVRARNTCGCVEKERREECEEKPRHCGGCGEERKERRENCEERKERRENCEERKEECERREERKFECHNPPIELSNKGCCADPCDQGRCVSVYEASIKGLQFLLGIQGQDTLNKWFAIIGHNMSAIASQLK